MEQDYSWIKEFVILLPLLRVAHYSRKYMITQFNHLQLIKTFEDGKILCIVFQMNLILYDPKTMKIETFEHKLHNGTEEKLWIYQIRSFNFCSLQRILGLNG